MRDDIDITGLEQLLSSGKRPSEMTPEDFSALAQTLDALVDRYGEDHIRTMLGELAEMTAQIIRARLPINDEQTMDSSGARQETISDVPPA